MAESQDKADYALPEGQEALDSALINTLHAKEPDFHKAISLLAAGANPNARDEDDVPAFHAMVEWGNTACVKAALKVGADVHSKDRYEDTPLHKAIAPDMSLLLLLEGASPSVYNIDAMRPRAAIGQSDNTLNYGSVLGATKILLSNAEVIEEQARKFSLSEKTWEDLWPKNAFDYPGPSSPLPHNSSLQYFLKKAEETGADFGKSALFSTTIGGEGLAHCLNNDAGNIRAWDAYCDRRGEPMTPKDWQNSDALDNIKPAVAAGLFDGGRWTNAPDLTGLYALFEVLPENVKKDAESSAVGTAVNNAIYSWLNEGAGAALDDRGVRKLRNEMPEEIKPLFKSFNQEIQSRRHSNSTLGR